LAEVHGLIDWDRWNGKAGGAVQVLALAISPLKATERYSDTEIPRYSTSQILAVALVIVIVILIAVIAKLKQLLTTRRTSLSAIVSAVLYLRLNE